MHWRLWRSCATYDVVEQCGTQLDMLKRKQRCYSQGNWVFTIDTSRSLTVTGLQSVCLVPLSSSSFWRWPKWPVCTLYCVYFKGFGGFKVDALASVRVGYVGNQTAIRRAYSSALFDGYGPIVCFWEKRRFARNFSLHCVGTWRTRNFCISCFSCWQFYLPCWTKQFSVVLALRHNVLLWLFGVSRRHCTARDRSHDLTQRNTACIYAHDT